MDKFMKITLSPKEVFREVDAGNAFKSSLGELGLFEQSKMNERFFIGDHWHGVNCGSGKPLARRNIVKRIGEYKMSAIGSAPITVRYSAEGVPSTDEVRLKGQGISRQLAMGETPRSVPDSAEISAITEALSSYQKICAERLRFDLKTEQLLRNAYISGTGIAYTYWDSDVRTGLFADSMHRQEIVGDIGFQVLDVENVIFGEPRTDDVSAQPYIIILERLSCSAVRREAKKNGRSTEDILPEENGLVTVATKLYKEWTTGGKCKIMATKVTNRAVIKPPFDTGLTLYPIAKFSWERRRKSIYGESEITYLIPNQIAINRMLTAECWSAMAAGMPKLLVNSDLIDTDVKITNDPGQVIRIPVGFEGNLDSAMSYLSPAPWASQYSAAVSDLAAGTMSDAGANDAALGNIRPDNAAAIIAMREAALQPMQLYQNRYYAFIEDIARIWADFWLSKYGRRAIPADTPSGREYITFIAERYRNLVLEAKVDVGASTLYSEAVVISTLDGLLSSGIITPKQYFERMPKGVIPKVGELIEGTEAIPQGEAII